MSVKAEQIRSYRRPGNWAGKFVQFPLVRTFIGIFYIVPVMLLAKVVTDLVIDFVAEPYASYLQDLSGVVRIGLALYMYSLFTRSIEKRPALEISSAGSVRETAIGIGLGGGLMVVMVGLLWLMSYYRVESFGSFDPVIHSFFFFAFAALIEELVFRGLLFRHLEELTGSLGAVIITGTLFGLVHIANENATAWTSAAIALQSLILSGTYMFTRRIWLVWGLHLGWNYFQNGILGVAVSGSTDMESFIRPVITGPEWLTGGSFGVEGSVVTTALVAVIGFVFIRAAAKRGNALCPLWTRRFQQAAGDDPAGTP